MVVAPQAFLTRQELAEFIYGEYGDRWMQQIKSTTQDGDQREPPCKRSRSIYTPDIEGHAPFLGEIVIAKECYAIYNLPADGSYFYHAFSSII